MKIKAALLVILTTFLVLILGLIWQINDIQRGRADENQLGKEQTIQPSFVDNDSVFLSLIDEVDKVKIGETINYTISYQAKKDLQKVRIVGSLGETNQNIYPSFSWNIDDLKAGTVGSFTVPVTLKAGNSNLAVSRITLSTIQKSSFLQREKRDIIGTCDDINQIAE